MPSRADGFYTHPKAFALGKRAAHNRRAWRFRNRSRLAGNQGLIDLRRALHDDPVHRHTRSGPNQDNITDTQFCERHFLDNLDKSWLVKFIEQRVADPRILRLIQKWLKAGVMEEGKWSEPQTGSPQGSVISPLLANLYLHYCFDLWVNVWRKKRAQGEVVVLRYADDTVLGFQYQTEADRFLRDLRDRLKKFGLELHPDKTRRIEFGRFAEENRKRRGEGKPETFDFLGFTHISGKNRLGRFAVRRLTIRKRMRSKLRAIKQQLRPRMHDPVRQTGAWLRSVVQGYFNYYAVPGNIGSLSLFRDRLLGIWWHTLCRRSQQRLPWKRMLQLGDRWLPRPRVLHPYPAVRFAATHPR